MPSLRKLVEDVEYNTLPSPTKEGFAAAARAKLGKTVKAVGDGSGVITLATNKVNATQKDANASKQKNENVVGNREIKTNNQTNGSGPSKNSNYSQQKAIEIQSDEEEISLNDLAKLNQNGSSTTKAKKCAEATKTQAGEIGTFINGSIAKRAEKDATGMNNEVTKSNHNHSKNEIERAKANGTNGKSTANNTSGENAKPVQKIAPTLNDSQAIAAPQIQHPYSANPTVRENANAVLHNIRMNLQHTLPMHQPSLQQFPFGPAATIPGLERWSEHRIDSAANIEGLEAIRRRLLTLTNRVDLRLKEMNFLKAIGMTENADDGERETTQDLIRKLVERAESNLSTASQSGHVDVKRKRTLNESDDVKENGSEKRQRSCCPFCLSTPRETDEMYNCSICDEKSDICSQCRGYCIKCNRMACEDCLVRCDTCYSDTYCSDCMSTSGQCAKCTKSMPRGQIAQRNVGVRAISEQTIPSVTQLQPVVPDHILHRFVVTKFGTLGLKVGEIGGVTRVHDVYANSHAEIIGIKQDDEVCYAFTNGKKALHSCKSVSQ
jgi:hypothetical protein